MLSAYTEDQWFWPSLLTHGSESLDKWLKESLIPGGLSSKKLLKFDWFGITWGINDLLRQILFQGIAIFWDPHWVSNIASKFDLMFRFLAWCFLFKFKQTISDNCCFLHCSAFVELGFSYQHLFLRGYSWKKLFISFSHYGIVPCRKTACICGL